MSDTPIVVTRSRSRVPATEQVFSFQKEQVRLHATSNEITRYRQQAWEQYQQSTMPTVREEAWRRTDLRALKVGSFQIASSAANLKLPPPPTALLEPIAGEDHGGQVILRPGVFEKHLAQSLADQGVVFTDLLTAEKEYPELVTRILGKTVPVSNGKFAALAGALSQMGTLLYVPEGVTVEQPLHSLMWGPGSGLAYISHLLVFLEPGASVTYVHEAASPDEDDQSMHVGIVEGIVSDGATLRFVELQSWGEHVWNFSHERIRVERNGTLDWIFGALGSRLTKNFSELDLAGEGSTGKMSGFYFTDNQQHLDHDTQQNHLAPHTTSDLLFKGTLLGESRSVWQGMIYVAPGAFKTDGYQANRNLVLSKKARADSIPGLEILADDVRCTHGATVGRIDEEQIFYLLSRGIPRRDAERLVVEGFFDPIMQRIPFDGVRQRFQEGIHRKMASLV
jgi:Fe-S cluster assembly protein SufD